MLKEGTPACALNVAGMQLAGEREGERERQRETESGREWQRVAESGREGDGIVTSSDTQRHRGE